MNSSLCAITHHVINTHWGVQAYPRISNVSGHFHAVGEERPVHVGEATGWASEPVWTLWKEELFCSCLEANLDYSV
jgi:hypothetical protein